MKVFLRRLLKSLAYLAAGLVILLAVGVGLFRLLLPRLPEYQEEIKAWANSSIGLHVEFTGMDARWRLSGPELNFYNASLRVPGSDNGVFAAEEVSVGVGLMRLLLDRTLVVDRIGVHDADIALRRSDDGGWLIQGIPLSRLTERFPAAPRGREIKVVAEDLMLEYRHSTDGPRLSVVVDSLQFARNGEQLDAEAIVELPESLGSRVLVTAGNGPGRTSDPESWHVTVDGRGLNLAGWSVLQPEHQPRVTGGAGDLNLALDWRGNRISNVTANLDITALQTAAAPAAIDAAGRIEYERDDDGWLLAAENVRLTTGAGAWPETDIQAQVGTAPDGRLRSMTVTASYLDLADLAFAMPWIPEAWQEQARRYDPSGTVSDLTLRLDDLTGEQPHYDVAMQLQGAGILAGDHWPGVRGYTGSLRANRSGGRLEIDATDLELDMSQWLPTPVELERAEGTVIWRRNRDGIIVISDNVALRNADMASRSSLQISLPADGGAPVVDLESRWSIGDIDSARRYLPGNLIKPALYRWLNSALVAGRIPQGTMRLSGPLDQFPFDNGEGVFRIEATLEDATLRYSDLWPAVENLDLGLIVEGTRLYSDSNTAVSAGNSVVDAEIEIKDLRSPILTIETFATGSLKSIRQFARHSPIAEVFGGHLERVTVDGEATFNLSLRYPILNRDDYDFTAQITARDASLRIEGLPPPVTELNGVVNLTRRDIGTESFRGKFLGQPMAIDLRPAGDALPSYSVVATLTGNATPEGVEQGFDVPVSPVLGGSAAFDATLKFPRAGADEPMPMQIEIRTDMKGIDVALPSPLGKDADSSRSLSALIEFPESSEIDTQGRYGDDIQWALEFRRREAGWDFDRGVLAAGGAEPGLADTRGLHIVGQTPELRLRDWLALASGEASGAHLSDRVRSLNLAVQDLYILGQHFNEHRVIVDRSASDWLVQLEGEQANGTVTIPYDFNSGRALTVDMQRLILPGSDDESPNNAISTDPRTIPPLSIRVEEFGLGSRYLGRIEADFEKTPDGLRANGVRTVDDTFSITGSAGWEVDTSEPTGQRTDVEAVLKSSDVDATMKRLNSRPGIDGEDMEIRFDVNWSGGPREDFLSSLDGNFVVRFGTGQLVEVEPGAGRMFGLMSVVALPRRLSLDFRDVLDKGFVFDEITGVFRVEDGNAYTCDLSLKGPAADIGIVGRAGLVAQDYDQSAMVSANVGNTLPVVGAVVAGPQVAAALLIFSQIFKKPLQEMGQIYYAIEGSWDEPRVDTAGAGRFAQASRVAGCLEDAG